MTSISPTFERIDATGTDLVGAFSLVEAADAVDLEDGAKGSIVCLSAPGVPALQAAAANGKSVVYDSDQPTGLRGGERRRMIGSPPTSFASSWNSSSAESGPLHSVTIPGGTLKVGDAIFVRGWGGVSTTGAPNFTLRNKFNDGVSSQAIGTISSGSPGSGASNALCTCEGCYIVQAIGASGAIAGYQKGTNGTSTTDGHRGHGTITIDTTADIDVEHTAQFSVPSVSNAYVAEGLVVEIVSED